MKNEDGGQRTEDGKSLKNEDGGRRIEKPEDGRREELEDGK